MLDEKTYKAIYGEDIDEVLAKRKARDNKNFNISIVFMALALIGLFGFDCIWSLILMFLGAGMQFNNFCVRDAERLELMAKYFNYQDQQQNKK